MAIDSSMGRRTFLKGTAAAAAMTTLAACGGANPNETLEENAEASQNPAAGEGNPDAIARMYLNNPECIEPYNLQENQGTQVGFQLFDTLVKDDYDKGELQPAAAADWSVNEEATEFTFHLVTGATFANGDPVTAECFKRGWTRIVDPNTNPSNPSVISYHLSMVEGYQELSEGQTTDFTGVQAPADDTLVVTLSEPYADFLYVCCHPALVPVPQAAIDDAGSFYTAPIGNGPFMMDGEWQDGQEINVVRYDDYYGMKATIGGIHFNIQKDLETGWREFQAGNLDVCDIPAQQVPQAIEDYGASEDGYTITPGHQVLNGDQTSTYYLVVNCEDPVLSEPALRRAISLCINRQAICDTLFQGTRSPADNIVPPGINGYEPEAWPYSKYDPDQAKQVLSDAGIDPSTVNLILSCNGDGGHADIMAMIQSDLEAIGITSEIEMKEWATILDDYQAGAYQIGRLGWIADYPIMDNFLFPLFYTDNGDNRSQYSNPDVDAALSAARTTVDDAERIAALQEVNRTIAEDCPVIPIMFYKFSMCGSDHVLSLYEDPQGKFYFAQSEFTE